MKHIKSLFFLFILLFSSSFIVYAEYLSPELINGENCYNIYDILDIKNGNYKDIYDSILGNGKEFYLNKCLFKIYENSIVYYIDGRYEPIGLTEYSSNGYTIQLPALQKPILKENTLYLSADKITDYFNIDVESKGILYETEEDKNEVLGVDFSFLKEKITSLGYVSLEDFYFYMENDIINNYIFFYEDSIVIQWNYNTSEKTIDLLLQALFPQSYPLLQNNLFNVNGNYDNRNIKTFIQDDYLYIEINNKLEEKIEEIPIIEDEGINYNSVDNEDSVNIIGYRIE